MVEMEDSNFLVGLLTIVCSAFWVESGTNAGGIMALGFLVFISL